MPPVPRISAATSSQSADGGPRPQVASEQTWPLLERLAFSDLPQVMSIERRSYAAPWSLSMFALEVAKPAGLSIGASLPDPQKPRQAPRLAGFAVVTRYDDAFHVMNICVDPIHRRIGLARTMLNHVIDAAGGDEARLTLEVRPSNLSARALYGQLGFVEIGRRYRYYRDDNEDALIMWRTPGILAGRLDDVPGVPGGTKPSGAPVPPDVLFPKDSPSNSK